MGKTPEDARLEAETVYIDSEGRPWGYTTNDQGHYGKYERISHGEGLRRPIKKRMSHYPPNG